uniref:Acetylornithine/succinylornithine family transaminase n=1 Tax=Eiseniibacteriota bacterium TaxID=2212470 RepID=A0A832IAP2_UNCEI
MTDALLTPPAAPAAAAGVPAASGVPPAEALAVRELDAFAPTYPLPRLELVAGRGARVTAADGREYLDFVSGIAVNALGHGHAGLARAVAKQMRTLGHVSNLYATPAGAAFARALLDATGYDRVFLCNSGAEAVEAALKFARAHARARGRAGRDIVAFRGGFHGRTGFALSATWTPSYREPFEPLVPGVRFADFNDAASLDGVLDDGACAAIVEPVQGEGGAVPASKAFLEALRARCDAAGALLVFDEIQCGMGRCGRLLAAAHYGVRADLTVLSKALGGGFPVGAVLMTAEVAASLAPGMHGSTFGGNPVAAAAAAWMLAKINRPSFLARVRRSGRALEAALAGLVARHAASLAAARGLGLLRAVELRADAGFDPAALVAAARREGLLLVRGGERAVRLLPPLNVTDDEIQEAVARLDRALTALEAATPAHAQEATT